MDTTTRSPKMSTTQRTDIHRPSLLDPSEYSFLGCFYQGSSDAMAQSYVQDETELHDNIRESGATKFKGGNYEAKMTCDHCGAIFAHGVCFLHTPTGEYITVGHICASDTIGLPSRAAVAKRSAEKAAALEAERIKRHEANTAWREANGDIIEFLAQTEAAESAWRTWNSEHPEAGHPRDNGPRKNPNRAPHPFLLDMVHTFAKWGNLSERQAAATRKFIAGAAKFAAAQAERETEAAPEVALIEGRREVTGIVISTKWTEDRGFGSQPKMLVKEADGNKVWGTVAESIFSQGFDLDGLKGETVIFKATIERSQDDEHFGFYKRPSNARVIEKEVAAA
jgi:hypothetical protein